MVISSLVFIKIWFLQIHISSVHGRNTNGGKYEIPDIYTTCSKGWYSYGDMCYNLGGKKITGILNWENAKKTCQEEHGGILATVNSKDLQDFLTAILLMRGRASAWIGLNDRDKEGEYKWVDGTKLNFTYYEHGQPDDFEQREDCFEMLFKSFAKNGKPGVWNDRGCNDAYQFICQKPKGEPDPIKGPRLDPRFCESEKGIGWSFDESCFHLITETKTWSDAEETCVKEYNGHLATLDYRVNEYLKYVLRDINEQIWIGVKIKEETQQKWSSGWLVSYENWLAQEEYVDGTCLLLDEDGSWLIQFCKKKLWFLCEHSTASPPPVLRPPPKDVFCPVQPTGWRDLGGELCYFFDIFAKVSWYEANYNCMRRGGTLASIHSEEEIKVFFQFLRYDRLLYPNIGFFRHMQNEEFVWADGSKVDFVYWDSGEPNAESEGCTEIKHNMKWNDRQCTDQTGYICSIRKTGLNTSTTECPAQKTSENIITTNSLIGVITCVLIFSLLIGLVMYHFKICDRGYDKVKQLSGATLQMPKEQDKKARYRSEIVVSDDADYDNVV